MWGKKQIMIFIIIIFIIIIWGGGMVGVRSGVKICLNVWISYSVTVQLISALVSLHRQINRMNLSYFQNQSFTLCTCMYLL